MLISENRFRANGERHWTLQFQYDQNGSPVGVSFRDCGESTFTYVYYYAKNLQGDIVGLYKRNPDGTGAQVIATYEYDPWGKVTAVRDANGNLVTYPSASNLIAFMNPLRYRGYYQDNDTGFYYLQSRYYDPELRRFINADSYSSTGQGFLGHNMFAYCNNDPIISSDPDGKWLNFVIGAVVGAAINVVAAALEQKPIDEVIVSGICGAVSGGLTAAGFGTVAGAVSSFVDSAYENTKAVIRGEKTIGQAVVGTAVSTAIGTAFGAMGSGSAADIAKSNQISNAGWKGVKTLLSKGVRPAIKKTAEKSVRKAFKYTLKTLGTEILSGGASTLISKGVSWFTDRVYKNYAAAF